MFKKTPEGVYSNSSLWSFNQMDNDMSPTLTLVKYIKLITYIDQLIWYPIFSLNNNQSVVKLDNRLLKTKFKIRYTTIPIASFLLCT